MQQLTERFYSYIYNNVYRRLRRRTPVWLSAVAAAVCLTACHDDASGPAEGTTWHTRSVAVVLPMDNGLRAHWESTLGLCRDNLRKGQSLQAEGIDLRFEFYDESCDTLKQLARTLARREDIVAVIGGLYTVNARQLADELCRKKPFFTLSTAEEPVRAYTSSGFLWAMTETDITQCEVLLSKASAYGAQSVALIASEEDAYGKTFIDWFSFQTKELGMRNAGIYTYTSASLQAQAEAAMDSGADYLICIPSEIQDMEPMIDSRTRCQQAQRPAPQLLFSDTAYGADVPGILGEKAEGVEGVCFASDPESGFDVAYEVKFGRSTTLGEAQVYDAATLIGLACFRQLLHPDDDLTTQLRALVDGRDPNQGGWTGEGLCITLSLLAAGRTPDLHGASGSLNFDAKVYTNVLSTVYRNFQIYHGHYLTLGYNTSDGSKRSDATLAGWAWKAEQLQEFSDTNAGLHYPQWQGNRAVLVAASSGWENYRHQADVYNMYRILRSQGYTDDDIILIAEDDIAQNPANPEPGVVRVRPDGENVYRNIQIDYHPSDITAADINDILCGRKSKRLPIVLESDSCHNVLFFWSGHGVTGQFNWLDTHDNYRQYMARECFEAMSAARRYRKLLCLFETCYSGSVAMEAEGLPGILCITAANEYETSKADNYSQTLGTWMSNRFTSTLQAAVEDEADISLRDLYYRLFINTVGSHVTVYNAACYGNLYRQTLGEFFIPAVPDAAAGRPRPRR